MNFDDFKNDCWHTYCPRSNRKSTHCCKEYKQKICYEKYIKKIEKDYLKQTLLYEKELEKKSDKLQKIYEQKNKELQEYLEKKEKGEEIEYLKDEKWEELKFKLFKRDKSCLLSKILTEREKQFLNKYQKDFLYINNYIDGAHILSRNEAPNLVYEVTNVILLGRLFHQRLDSYQNPLTGKSITIKERKRWFERIMIQNNLWEKNYTFDLFKERRLNEHRKI